MKQTDTKAGPYYDDFDPEKGFQQILFQPRTVQARELNQLQTILQTQLERLGSHMFQEGATVIPGGFSTTRHEVSLGLKLLDPTKEASILGKANVEVRSTASSRKIRVNRLLPKDSTYDTTAIGDVIDSGTSLTFNVGERVYINVDGSTDNIPADVTVVGKAVTAAVETGVYYARGFFISLDRQEVVVDRYSDTSDRKIGFLVDEDIVTATTDITLYSNATGTPNAKAIGADRLRIKLKLASYKDSEVPSNFIQLMDYSNGNVSTQVDNSQYNLLANSMAQRTFEQAGDYTTDEHEIDIEQHPTIETKLQVSVDSGTSYVRGHRIRNDDRVRLDIDKSRKVAFVNNTVTSAVYGSFITVNAMKGTTPIGSNVRLELRKAGVKVGDAIVVSVKPNGSTSMDIYLRDIKTVGSTLGSYDSVYWTNSDETSQNVTVFTGTVVKGLQDEHKAPLLFPLPFTGVQTTSPSGANDTTFRTFKRYRVTLDASGAGQVSAGVGLVFGLDAHKMSIAPIDSTVGPATDLTFTDGGNGASVNVRAPSLANKPCFLIAEMIKSNPFIRSKTSNTISKSITFATANVMPLGVADVYKIVSVKDSNGVDVTSEFTLETGITESMYEISRIKSNSGNISKTITVVFKYYNHGTGDYFCVDSYSSVDYTSIPTQNFGGVEYDMRDHIDFRRVAGNDAGDMIAPNSSIFVDLNYYLSRIDTLFLTPKGVFSIQVGESADNPVAPSIPTNCMRMYDFLVPPYTFTADSVQRREHITKNYTMEDIGKLDARINNVEQTTSLNLLEADVKNIQVFDSRGMDRFKNGLFADKFVDQRLFDPDADGSNGSLDPEGGGGFRPATVLNQVDMKHLAGGVNRDNMVSLDYTTKPSISNLYATDWINVNPYAVFSWAGWLSLNPTRDFWTDVRYTTPRIINTTVNNRGSVKEGTKVWYSNWGMRWRGWRPHGGFQDMRDKNTTTVTFTSSTSSSKSTAVVSESIIPFMRSIAIKFSGGNLRPNARVYPFFNGVNVSAYCTQDGKLRGAPLITDTHGAISGTFLVPNSDAQRFSTGNGTFILSDGSPSNPEGSADVPRTTWAGAGFQSGGKVQTRQTTTVNTRTLSYTTRQKTEIQRRDPIAQSFTPTNEAGDFVDAIDVYFRSKSESIPITLEIRGMENGTPSEEVLTRVSLNPSAVNISTNGTTATKFRLPHPVFLEGKREFCFVLLANTQAYNAYYSRLGRKSLSTGYALAKQPHTGVMFKSSNGSTWTPDQNADLTFAIHTCQFSKTSEARFVATDGVEFLPLPNNAISGVAAEKKLTVYQRLHGLKVGDTFSLNGSKGGIGIPHTEINTTHTVLEVVDQNRVRFETKTAVGSTGIIADTDLTMKGRYRFAELFANIEDAVLDGTNITWYWRYTRDSSRSKTDWTVFEPRTSYVLRDTGEGTQHASEDFEIKAVMTTNDVRLSPQIDMYGFTTVMSGNDVDVKEKLMGYVTRPMIFENPSESAIIYIGALLPTNSSMKVYFNYILPGGESGWLLQNPSTTVLNNDSSVLEHKFVSDESSTTNNDFLGLKVKIELTGDRHNPPMLRDMRGVVLA
ncbi:hypothetical protein VPHK469_0236 [Vibrio phage K469]